MKSRSIVCRLSFGRSTTATLLSGSISFRNPIGPYDSPPQAKAISQLSDSRKFQLEFWTCFSEKLAKTKKITSLQTPKGQYWYSVSLGKSDIHLSNTCNTDSNTVGVRVYIRNKIAEKMLPFLESKKSEIETAVGQALQWNSNPENMDKIILLTHVTDFKVPAKINEALEWLVIYTVKFREIFSRLVTQMNIE